jgi:hypothetical protein
MTTTLPGADIRGFYYALGVELPDRATAEASVRCFADPAAHAHNDRNPSCSVSLVHGAWHCWGCGAKGGAYDAALELGRSPREAMDLLISFGIAQRRPGRGRGSGAPAPRPRGRSSGLVPRTLRSSPPQLAVNLRDVMRWKRSLLRRTWPAPQLRDQHRRLWRRSVVDDLDLGWDRGRLTIPIRDDQGNVRGVLRYRPHHRESPKMLAVPGSRLGLIPHPMTEASPWVLLTEGPPDVIAARSRGLPAIAVPGDHAWEPAWASTLAGKRVVIAMDCDTQGRAAAERIASDLAGIAASVTTADVAPHLDSGYDLTDWLDQHRHLHVATVRALFEP